MLLLLALGGKRRTSRRRCSCCLSLQALGTVLAGTSAPPHTSAAATGTIADAEMREDEEVLQLLPELLGLNCCCYGCLTSCCQNSCCCWCYFWLCYKKADNISTGDAAGTAPVEVLLLLSLVRLVLLLPLVRLVLLLPLVRLVLLLPLLGLACCCHFVGKCCWRCHYWYCCLV